MHKLMATSLAVILFAAKSIAEPASFDTPQTALDEMMSVLVKADREGLLIVFGPEAEDLIFAADAAEREADRQTIIALHNEGYRFQPNEDGVTLILGEEGWPFPIPIIRADDLWQFDVVAGRDEIANREIGRNELDVIDLLEAYVDLQASFRLVDHDEDGVMEFAQWIVSDAEAKDGLFWPGGPGLIGEALARASLLGWSDGESDFAAEPFFGYFFTILHGQGDNAPGGAMSYLAEGNLVAGHALLAIPAEYGVTGIHSFLVGENGVVFEADFGEETLERSSAIARYDPGPDWRRVN